MKRKMIVFALTMVMVLGMSLTAGAESYDMNGTCYFDGDEIICDFDSDKINDTIRGLEPGDDVNFEVEFSNEYSETTHWYMRNEALATLEQSFDRAENGGYTYILTHVAPNGDETVLFDNSSVGGMGADGHSYAIKPKNSSGSHGSENTGEGLHQATNATDEWFFIQTLKKGQSGKTKLYVKFDGESEVNDYMDTAGELLVAYAVELDETDKPFKTVKTGDSTDILTPLAVMLAAMLMLIFLILSYRKDRRETAAEVAGAATHTGTEAAGKERE